jgi:hypothetical protein
VNSSVPRTLIVALAATFSAYHLVLAGYSISLVASPWPVLVAGVLYASATTLSLAIRPGAQLPRWVAVSNVLVSTLMCVLVSSQIDLNREGGTGFATWYIAAVGTLMTITSTRRQHLLAWIGTAILVVHTLVWAGPTGVANFGVIGCVAWVSLSHTMSMGITSAERDARRFALAEREATQWQAAQEAYIYERQSRIAHTSSMALTTLTRIRDSGGALTRAERAECVYVESAIRDELRGRALLNDRVRAEVRAARLRGATVIVLDEGGCDDLGATERDLLHTRIATALHDTTADHIIVRSTADNDAVVATVVGVNAATDDIGVALGTPDADHYSVDLFIEIPRALD